MVDDLRVQSVGIGFSQQLVGLRPEDKIRDELRQIALDNNILYDQLLRRYASERVLHRACTLNTSQDIVLRGAWAIETRLGVRYRRWTTVQLAVRDPRQSFDEAASAHALVARAGAPGEDGLDYWSRDVRVTASSSAWPLGDPPRRVKALINFDTAEIPFEAAVDFNLPDVPEADVMRLETLLDLPAPRVKVARFETMVAEKLKRIVEVGTLRFRARDYFDLWLMANTDPLDELEAAVEAVFLRRFATRLPTEVPPALTDRFATSEHAQWHWSVFLERGCPVEKVGFRDVVAGIRERAVPLFEAMVERRRRSRSPSM